MPKLSEKLCPGLLTSDALKRLQGCGVRTVADIIGRDVNELAVKSSIPREDLVSIQRSLVSQFATFPVRGGDLYDELLSNFCILSTGCDNLDQLLDGGLYTGEVTELVGPAGAGKTQVCMSISAFIAKETQRTVLYVDTGGTFSSKRLQGIIHCRFADVVEQQMPVILSRVHCVQVFDVFTLIEVLENLKETLNKEESCLVGSYPQLFSNEDQVFLKDLRLIIVDSVASVISPNLGGHQCHGHALMVQLARSLKSLSMDYGIAVVVTNNVVSDSKSRLSSKPALGPTWSHLPNTRVFVYKSDRSSQNKTLQSTERIATLTKSSRQPLQTCTLVQIGAEGMTSGLKPQTV